MKIVDGLLLNVRRAVKPHDVRRRWLVGYGLLLVLLFVALTLLRFAYFGDTGYWAGLVDKMSAALLLALVAAGVLAIVVPPISFAEDLAVLDAWNIGPKLNEPLGSTREYWFRGRSGRWFRAKAIPKLAAAARRDKAQRLVHMILPDPADQTVMDLYARYRNSIAGKSDAAWTAEAIRNEIFATLIVAGKAQADTQYFRPEVSLLSEFSLFRTDLSDEGLILTREDPRWPGWISPNGTKFYDSTKEDLRMAKDRGRPVDLSAATWPASVTAADVPQIVSALGFGVALTPDACRKIVAAAKRTDSPYD